MNKYNGLNGFHVLIDFETIGIGSFASSIPMVSKSKKSKKTFNALYLFNFWSEFFKQQFNLQCFCIGYMEFIKKPFNLYCFCISLHGIHKQKKRQWCFMNSISQMQKHCKLNWWLCLWIPCNRCKSIVN